MRKGMEVHLYRALVRWETLKRTLPLWVILVLALALEACKKKR